MQESKKSKINLVRIPKAICQRFKLHRWFWTSRLRATISATCARCGMNGLEYRELEEKSQKKS